MARIINFFGTILYPDQVGDRGDPRRLPLRSLTVARHATRRAGLTWVLSIVGLVLVVRAALIPIFVRQIKSQRKMMEVAPQLKKIQDKYKGKKDQFSREAMQRETMELYSKAGTNPLARACRC